VSLQATQTVLLQKLGAAHAKTSEAFNPVKCEALPGTRRESPANKRATGPSGHH